MAMHLLLGAACFLSTASATYIWSKASVSSTLDQVNSSKSWKAIAMSSDGMMQTAVTQGADGNSGNAESAQGLIWTSSDSGATWIADSSVGDTKAWSSVAMSTNGMY